MREDEQETAHIPAAIYRVTLAQKYGEPEYIPHYIAATRQHLHDSLVTAWSLVSDNADSAVIHFHRRLVAFYHQELELWGQGADVWLSAMEDHAHVLFGRGHVLYVSLGLHSHLLSSYRVHKRRFKKLYGF